MFSLARIPDIPKLRLCCCLTNSHSLFKKNVSYPSPSRYACVSLHTGRTRPMVHWSLQGGREDTETRHEEGGLTCQSKNQKLLTEWKSYLLLSLWHCTPTSRSHTPFWVGEIHAQQYALLFVAKGWDNDQIPDSDRADGLQLHRLQDKRMWETERWRARAERQPTINILYMRHVAVSSEVWHYSLTK